MSNNVKAIQSAIDNLARVLEDGLAGLKAPAPAAPASPFVVTGSTDTRLPDAAFVVHNPTGACVTIWSDFVPMLIRRLQS